VTNPFLDLVPAPVQSGGGSNPFLDLGGVPRSTTEPDFSTARKRAEQERKNLEENLLKLKSITPANEGHKNRLDKMVRSIEMQLADRTQGRGTGENLYRGLVSGIVTGAQFPVELAGNVMAILGNKDLQNYVEENRALVKEEIDPEGIAGTVGEIGGGIIGAAGGAGGIAAGTGKAIIRIAPSTRIARAIAAGSQGGLKARVATNVLTGLPVNTLQAAGMPEIEIPEGTSPEEAERIRSLNTANKLKSFAIGIGADALFGAIPGRKPADQQKPAVPAGPQPPIADPKVQEQLDKVKAQNAVKVAAKRRERLDKALAQSEWQILNPDAEWKELNPKAKREIYDKFVERRRNTNGNTSADGNEPDQKAELVDMDEQLKKLRGERDEARRLAETDSRLQIGNDRALTRAAAEVDKNPNLVYIFADVNGLKGVNDKVGMDAGNQLLLDSRDALLSAMQDEGLAPRVFRYGGDELVAIVPKDRADKVLSEMERRSVKQYGEATGSLSGAVFSKLEEALSLEGKAQITSRKIEAKARQNIPGRDAQEQAIIDQVRQRLNTEQAAASAAQPTSTATPEDPFPPEVMEAIRQVESAGGLQTPDEQEAFLKELMGVFDKEMDDAGRASELQAIIEDFTPLDYELPARVETPTPEVVAPAGASAEGQTAGQVAPAVEAPAGTKLDTLEHKKPLEELTEKQLDKLDDKLTDALESLPKGSPEAAIIQADFDKVRAEVARRNQEAGNVAPLARPRPELPVDPASGIVKVAPKAAPAAEQPVPKLHPDIERIRKASPRKLSADELNVHIQDLEMQQAAELDQMSRNAAAAESRALEARAELAKATAKGDTEAVKKLTVQVRRLEGMAARGDVDDTLIRSIRTKLDKALEERAFRDKAANGVVPEIPKGAIQGTAGFAFGFAAPVDEEETDRVTNALMWAGVGVGAAYGIRRMAARVRTPELRASPSDAWPGSNIADKKIVHQEDLEEAPKHWMQRARHWYTGIVRRTYGMDVAVENMGGTKLPASRNPAKLAAMFGRWVSMAEGALQDKPVFVDLTGNVVPLPAKSYREILDMVDGDLKGLGKLMTARASIEGAGLRSVPLDPVTADLIYRSAPAHYHAAADAMRQFDLAMSTVLEEGGVLLPGSVQNFEQENFYAGLRKVFDPDGGPSKISRDPKTKKLIISPNPVKGRKSGQTGQVYNPAETSASMVPQIYRSAELNLIKNRLVDLWEAAGKPDYLLKQVERRKQPVSADQQLRIDALKQEIKGLDDANAASLVAAMDPKSLDPRSNMMTVYREGVLRTYRVDEDIAAAITSLQPDELEGVWKILGMPATIARQGVVLNPYFVLKQSFIDNWQATLNSQYGFRFGVDQFIGWYNTIRRTPEYQKFIAAGGGNSTLQSHDYANVRSALKAVRHGGGGPLETAVKQAREMKLLDAWRTLIVPFAESARVGEYLRARAHGASVLDGVYAAKHVTANFQQRGGFTAVRGLDRASMFLNPALQGLDQALYRMGANPFRAPEEGRKAAAAKYLSKAFVGITLPSMYFWFQNKDDKEISDLRKTESGSKFWFMRSPVDMPKMGLVKGDIVKIPKPIMDGQLFGTSMEAALDDMLMKDPASIETASKSIMREFSVNLLPTMGVLYYGLQTNTNMAFGNPIVPEGDQELAREHQGEGRASWASRVVSKALTPIVSEKAPEILKNATTPAGLDYIVSNVGGMLGQDGMLAVTQAVESQTKGYVPAKEEWPIVSRVFANYPSSNVAPLRRFYQRADRVQEVASTIAHLTKEDPERLLPYMTSNQTEYMLVGMFEKARQDIANYRRAAEDIKKAPAGLMTSEDRRLYQRQYMTLMIETARQVNAYAEAIESSMKPQ
jgi:GGDEF domain-containing protein